MVAKQYWSHDDHYRQVPPLSWQYYTAGWRKVCCKLMYDDSDYIVMIAFMHWLNCIIIVRKISSCSGGVMNTSAYTVAITIVRAESHWCLCVESCHSGKAVSTFAFLLAAIACFDSTVIAWQPKHRELKQLYFPHTGTGAARMTYCIPAMDRRASGSIQGAVFLSIVCPIVDLWKLECCKRKVANKIVVT